MDQELWPRAEALFHATLAHSPEMRELFLDEACGGDNELRREVERLISADTRAGSFLAKPMFGESAVPDGSGSLTGRQFGPYSILAFVGAGGMGEVYRAHDNRLGRDVAIKTLSPAFARDPERVARFRREARVLASLNHPNIAAIYGMEESAEPEFLVLELVEGDNLKGPLPLPVALNRVCQVVDALAAAHQHGIVHRDLKPANLKVTPDGKVKVLDFGLAKVISDSDGTLTTTRTAPGNILGTPGYMSPEQARGEEIDQRTDIWALGCILYELITGKRAFEGKTAADALAAILEHEPSWEALPTETPAVVRVFLRQCLQKDAGRRLRDIAAARKLLEEAQGESNHLRLSALVRRPKFTMLGAVAISLLAFLSFQLFQHRSRVHWVEEQAIPEISRLLDRGEFPAAYSLLRQAEAILPADPVLRRIHSENSMPTSFRSNPSGAEVWVQPYTPEDEGWLRLGTTPFSTQELLWGSYRFRVVKPGFQVVVGSGDVRGGTSLEFDLDASGSLPSDMVRIPGGVAEIPGLGRREVGGFLIDRYEITNAQYKYFIESGGYRKPEYWTMDFVKDGLKLRWEQAMNYFRDSTGRPGPATWELGEYAEGHGDYPVGGVSWYEAAAYAQFAGKQLPTIYHWQQAARPGFFVAVAKLSNFDGAGPASVGAYKGVGAFGTLDMAGNVREWCWNGNGGRRYTRGGAWNEPTSMFAALDTRLPWDRSAANGIRCVRYDIKEAVTLEDAVTAPIRDFAAERPAADEVFRVYRSYYAYDSGDLDSRVEGVDEENSYWRRERVSFAAAYGNERVFGYFYIPKHVSPPYQAIIYAHPGMAFRLPSPQAGEEHFFDFLVKTGRAFLLPVLKGQYQRRYASAPASPQDVRDRLILESKDFRRSIDYLASRPDVDRERLGVFGISRGACLLPILAVGESRLKAAVLASAGLIFDGLLPEADPFHFVTRFRVPTLMGGGRSDFNFPVESSQRPMFRLLGTPETDKRQLFWDGSHGDIAPAFQTEIREALDWFDRYLGTVE